MGLINWTGLSPIFIFLLIIFFALWAKGFYAILSRLITRSKLISLATALLLIMGITLTLIPIESIDRNGISKPMVILLFIYFWFINPAVCLFGFFELITIKRGHQDKGFNKERRAFLKNASLCSVAFLNLGVFSKPLLVPSDKLIVREFSLAIGDIKGLTIGFMSDLHAGFYLSSSILDKVLSEIRIKKSDFVFIGGDIVDHNPEDLKELDSFIDGLKEICPVIAVLGNHDIVSGDAAIEHYLKDKGVIVLRDEAIEIMPNLVICGLRDEKQESINRDFIKVIGAEKTIIVLSHSPKAIYKFAVDDLKRIDLFLSGHTHGGQIRLPGLGAIINPGGLEFQPGLIRVNKHMPPMIITTGIGYTGLPLRVNCEPEVVFVTMK